MGHTLIQTFNRAITVSGKEWLSIEFLRLLQEGPSSKRATETERIGLLIKRLQAIFDNNNSTVMRSLHLVSSQNPQAVPAMASVQHPVAASTLPVDQRLNWPLTVNVRPQHGPSPSISPPTPRPAPRPKLCHLCTSSDHWGDQCPHKEIAMKAVQHAMSSRPPPAALASVFGDVEAFARDYAYMSREEQEEWEAGHHEFDEEGQGSTLPR